MANRIEPLVVGEYYHIYNRGNTKQNIFTDDKDRDRFAKLLYLCNSLENIKFKEYIVDRKIDAWDFDKGEPIVSIGAWVLMPNHFHIYITPNKESAIENQISFFIKKLCTAYSMYFNKKHKRTGKLFEGHFKSAHIDSDRYAKYIFSYIHLNPIKLIDPLWKDGGLQHIKNATVFLDKYKWSSYQDYRNKKRSEIKIISPENFPDYFSSRKIFDKEIFEWLTYRNSFLNPKVAP
ncbi:MAG: transposase [Patescibacteria group bacterium]